jgi:hypothetical protein
VRPRRATAISTRTSTYWPLKPLSPIRCCGQDGPPAGVPSPSTAPLIATDRCRMKDPDTSHDLWYSG